MSTAKKEYEMRQLCEYLLRSNSAFGIQITAQYLVAQNLKQYEDYEQVLFKKCFQDLIIEIIDESQVGDDLPMAFAAQLMHIHAGYESGFFNFLKIDTKLDLVSQIIYRFSEKINIIEFDQLYNSQTNNPDFLFLCDLQNIVLCHELKLSSDDLEKLVEEAIQTSSSHLN